MVLSFPLELEALLNTTEENPDDEVPVEDSVQMQLEQLGPNPTLLQVATVLLKQSAKAESESRRARQKMQNELRDTIKAVKNNHEEISALKVSCDKTEDTVQQVQTSQLDYESRLRHIEHYVQKTYYMACENKQRNSKGNFILTGRHIPKMRPGENLLNIVGVIIFKKYEVTVHPGEFKVVHRLPGDRILFSLHNRLPGYGYDKLTSRMNSNPNPEDLSSLK